MHQNSLISIKEIVLKYQTIVTVLVIVLMVFSFDTFAGQNEENDVITVQQVFKKITVKDSVVLLDVRTDAEFDGSLGHIPGAILVPLAELEMRMSEIEGFKKSEIIVICRSGGRSSHATRFLREKGFDAYNMSGGMLTWNKMLESMQLDLIGGNNETISE